MEIIGYGICGPGEADRYMKATLDCFKRLCDDTIILCNNVKTEERDLIKSYGFKTVDDNREWGKNQNLIKEDFLKDHVSKLNPNATVCLDMDEVLDTTREKLEEYAGKGQAWYVFIANLWNDGYRKDWSFWNVRFWVWDWKEKLGEGFFKFENRPLHCGLAPKWCYTLNLHAPFLLRHYGLMLKEDRLKKVKRYEKYDPNRVYRAPAYYEALKTDEDEPFNQEDIQRQLDEHIDSIKQPLNKELPMKIQTKEFLVIREADGFVFGCSEQNLPNQLKRKFKGHGFKVLSEVGKEQRTAAPLVDKSEDGKKVFVYVANHDNKGDDDTEGHIARALEELGHKVIKVGQSKINIPDGDYLLCHKWVPDISFKGKKICWYFDKIDFGEGRKEEALRILENVDYFFTSDETFTKDNPDPKFHVLRQGVGYDNGTGKEIACPPIVFLGSPYGEREKWVFNLKKKFPEFTVYNNKFGKELNDVCVSAKIIVAPPYPSDDYYWSNRVYNLIGRGAFLLHPRLKGLEEELKDGKEIVYYDNEEDMYDKIEYYLKHEDQRKEIQETGREKVSDDITYFTRTRDLCSKLSQTN